jgi:hypothetical protein
LSIEFTRVPTDDKWETWIGLVRRLMGVTLTDELDSLKWRLTTTGFFFGQVHVC